MSLFFKNFKKSFIANGGHDGTFTIQSLQPQIARLKAEGMTGHQIGIVLAEHYKLHSSMLGFKELAHA